MTAPGVNQHGATPGESEYSWGRGILPPGSRGYEFEPVDMLRAIRQTDSTNPNAVAEDALVAGASEGTVDELGVFTPGTLAPGSTPLVVESGVSSSSGQHKRINPLLPKGGDPEHFSDGLQDGSGEFWRASLPPNPVT